MARIFCSTFPNVREENDVYPHFGQPKNGQNWDFFVLILRKNEESRRKELSTHLRLLLRGRGRMERSGMEAPQPKRADIVKRADIAKKRGKITIVMH